MSLEEAVAVIVPVCMDLKERHARGEKLYVHPSAIAPGADGLARARARSCRVVPTNAHDKHCLAPELQRTLEPGDAVLERLLGRAPSSTRWSPGSTSARP